MGKIEDWKKRAKSLEIEIYSLSLACRDSRVPWYAKLWILCLAAYAFSPIDLIPDFIPVLGYLDDLVLLPLGILFAIKMIPSEVLEECREKSQSLMAEGRPKNWVAAGIIICLWSLILMGGLFYFFG